MADKKDDRTIWSWALYDFANTIFSMNIISRYFPLWVTKTHDAPDLYLSVAISFSMLMVAVSIPVLGAVSDQTGMRIRPLIILTLACATFTAMIGAASSLVIGLILFALANYCYQSALVFYDGMLPDVSRGTTVARVAGLSVSLGYLGAIVGLVMMMPVAARFGVEAIYLPTGVLFVLFSIPCFVLVKDVRVTKSPKEDVGAAFRRIGQTFRELKKHRNLFMFMIANIFILDGVNTVITFMSVYANQVIGFEGAWLDIFLLTSIVGAAFGALMWGRITNRIGAHKALQYVCAMWLCVFVFAAMVTSKALFWVVGPMAGIALGGVWVAGRTLLIDLAPPERVGEFFGFYYMAGKFSAIMGPMVWGIIVYALAPLGGTLKHRVAVLSMAVFIAAGWWMLLKVKTGDR